MQDTFKSEKPTEEAIQRMLEHCDESTEYIKDNMIYCRKCNEPRREKKAGQTGTN